MKRFFAVFMILMLTGILLVGCARKPYMVPTRVTLKENETAFLVNLKGDTVTGQAKMDSLEYYEQKKVQAKEITIEQRWEQTGRKETQGQWIPSQKLIIVDRTPVTRLYYNETKNGQEIIGDKRGIGVETKSSVGVTIGVSLSGRIDEADASKYLFFYGSKKLADVMDNEVYGTATSVLGNYVGKKEYGEMTKSKEEMVKELTNGLVEQYAKFGITLYGVGLYGGIIPDNPGIQASIDALIIAQNNKAAAVADVATAEIKQQMTAINARIADVSFKEALAYYVRQAADKGIKIVPDVVSGDGSGLLLNINAK